MIKLAEMILKQSIIFLLSLIFIVSASDKLIPEECDAKAGAMVPLKSQAIEVEEIKAFSTLLNFIELICEEALKHENKKEFAVNWMEGLISFAEEIYKTNSYHEIPLEEHAVKFDEETLNCENKFDEETLLKSMLDTFVAKSQIVLSDESMSETSDPEGLKTNTPSDSRFMGSNPIIKVKMMKDQEYEVDGKEDDYSDDFEFDQDELDLGVTLSRVKVDHDTDDEKEDEMSDSEDKDEFQAHVGMKSNRRRGRGVRGAIGGIISSADAMNMAMDVLTSIEGAPTETGTENEQQISEVAVAGLNMMARDSGVPNSVLSGTISNFDQAAFMEQIQQQMMSQFMDQLVHQNPKLASLLQDEQGKLMAALGTDENGLPQLSREGVINFLRTSALPKLLNSAIKGKTGIDVLKSLSMFLRVLNEGLGIFEVILKVLTKATRSVRYYTLYVSSIVADMAREDNMAPLIDLSVSVDDVPEVLAKKSLMGGINKMFRKSIKKSGECDSDPNSPFIMGMQSALSKARDFTHQFQQLPPNLLLTVFHTIFTELEKRNGIIRMAIARKQQKTLLGLQESVNDAITIVYKAIIAKNYESADYLESVPPRVFTEILLSLISTINMEPAKLNSHINKVTAWIKPIMSILDQDAQLDILNFFLTDAEAEQVFSKSSSGAPVKKLNWSFVEKRP